MDKKLFPMTLTQRLSYDGYDVECQKLEWDHDDFNSNFSVYNLCECPEDAIIGRDLFDADDFIYAVRFGMDLRDKGYTDLQITERKWEYDDE